MKAIILAAGRGSRMNDITEHKPKCFSEIHGQRLIEWQIKALHEIGITEIFIVRGYLSDLFDFPYHYFDNPRWQETNMLRSLEIARDVLRSSACIITYSDIVYSSKSLRVLLDSQEDVAITYDPNWLKLWSRRFSDPLSDAESFKLDSWGYVTEIGNKSQTVEEIQGQYMGLCRTSPTGWYNIEQYLESLSPLQVDKMDMTSLFKNLITLGVKIKGIPINEPWYEVDSASDLEKYNAIPAGYLFEDL